MTYNSSDTFLWRDVPLTSNNVQYSRYYPVILLWRFDQPTKSMFASSQLGRHPKLRHGFAKSRRGVCITTYIPFVSNMPSDKTRLEKKTSVKMRESSMQGGVTAFSVSLSHVRSRLCRTQVCGELHLAIPLDRTKHSPNTQPDAVTTEESAGQRIELLPYWVEKHVSLTRANLCMKQGITRSGTPSSG